MFRTRDFLLLLLMVAFLVVAIGGTVWTNYQSNSSVPTTNLPAFAITSEEAVPAVGEVVQSPEEARAERLRAMREKIAGRGEVIAAAPVMTEELPSDEAVLSTPAEPGVEERCLSFRPYSGNWNPTGLQFEEVEGARLVFKAAPEPLPPAAPASTTSVTSGFVARDIKAQLPVRSTPLPTSSCIQSDVIGIATDGSLIRNSEASLYSVFGESTLIGYALDGYPLYGLSMIPTDACGGRMVGGQYHYYLSLERDTVINCFSGAPISL